MASCLPFFLSKKKFTLDGNVPSSKIQFFAFFIVIEESEIHK